MLAIFFLIAGLYMILKKEVRISSKKSIKGPVAQKIGLIFLVPALLSYILKLVPPGPFSVILAYVSLAGYAIATISIFYFIFFYKPTSKDSAKNVIPIAIPNHQTMKVDQLSPTPTIQEYKLDDKKRVLFVIIAVVAFFIVIGLGFVIKNALNSGGYVKNTQENNASYSKEEYIKQIVEDAKKLTTLPSQIDSGTTMVDIIAEPSAIRYQYVLHDLDTSALSNEILKSTIISDLCKNKGATNILDQGVNMEYSYTVKNSQKTFFISFSKEDCLISQLPTVQEQNKQLAPPIQKTEQIQQTFPGQKQAVDPIIKIQLCHSEALQFSKDSREEVMAELGKNTDYYSICNSASNISSCTMKLIEQNIATANSLENDYYNSKYQECLSN